MRTFEKYNSKCVCLNEHLKISLWVLFEDNSAALLNRVKVITASPELYRHGADRGKSHQCLASQLNCIWLKHTFAGSMYYKNHADIIFKMLKLIGLGFLLLLKYKSMLLHLKYFISVSKDFFETITKAKERLYPTNTGKKLLYFSPNIWKMHHFWSCYSWFTAILTWQFKFIFQRFMLLYFYQNPFCYVGFTIFSEQDGRIRILLTLLWQPLLGLDTRWGNNLRKGCSE